MSSKRIISLFLNYGNADYIGEPVSVLDHSLQAAQLAHERHPHDQELILAALLHDIGHLLGMEAGMAMGMNGCGIMHHEDLGAEFALKLGYSHRIAKFIRSHVAGKRYLCYKEPGYYDALTDASRTTLSFQGGPMTEQEANAFEQDPDFDKILLLRYLDEAAKDPKMTPPDLFSYTPLLDSLSSVASDQPLYPLSSSQQSFWKDNGYLIIRGLLKQDLQGAFSDGFTVNDVSQWVDEISRWPKTSNKWLIHHEIAANSDAKIMCRAENFVAYHDHMSKLCHGLIRDIASQLFEEAAVLFKEKINFKLVGGAGFAAHQDTPAYIGLAKDHISALVAIDACNESNGCLQVCPGIWNDQSNVPLLPSGVITSEAEAAMSFVPVLCEPGDLVFFNGYLPHRSNPNHSSQNRRAMFLTYNPLSQGDHHHAYYEAKHKGLEGFHTSSAISFQKDFQGTIVD